MSQTAIQPVQVITALGTQEVFQDPPTPAPNQVIVYYLGGSYPYVPSVQLLNEEEDLEEGEIRAVPVGASLKQLFLRNEGTAKFVANGHFTPLKINGLEKHIEEHGIDCSICKEPHDAPSKSTDHWSTHGPVRVNQCGHVFGSNCLWAWLYECENASCPCCRRILIHSGIARRLCK